MQIIGISASPRRSGNSDLILENILVGAQQAGAMSEAVFLSDLNFSSCVGCERCRKDKICTRFDDDLTPLYSKIMSARGLVLVSPVYNYNITSWMKAFIDRMYCYYDFDNERPRGWSSRLAGQGRKAILTIVAEQISKEDLGVTMEALRLPMQALGYEILGETPVLGMFDAGIVGDHPEVLNRAAEMGKILALSLSSQHQEFNT
jgi:multimeric flavodoxin WrbA